MSHRDVIEQQKGPNQIVRIRSDSETNLDDLFKAVTHPKDSQVALGVPMRLRNLPPSFFQQPERTAGSKSASHSRESSTDDGSSSTGSTFSPPPHPSGLPIAHPRAHSSPASLQQTYSRSTAEHQHLRQQSYDITDDLPLPPGWAMAKTATGQRYFLNHLTQTTTWEDPRKQKLHAAPSAGTPTPQHAATTLNLGPLPDGWEQSTTREGEVYFINHVERTTSWFDPRIPIHLQRPPVMQQSESNNHVQSGTQNTPPPSFSTSQMSSQMSLQQRQQKARLQRLQMERERLKLRQQEILRQTACIGNPMLNELMLRQSLGEEIPTSPTEPVSTTGMDPFLGGTDFHSRQESADSGLGLGPNYSLPHTPEDFLSNMEDSVDAVVEDSVQQNGDLGLDALPNSQMDLGTENMDSEDLVNDLVPSLQEELNADILPDIETLLNSNKDNVLTWL